MDINIKKNKEHQDKTVDNNSVKSEEGKNMSTKSSKLSIKKVIVVLCAVLSLSQIVCMHFGCSLPLSLLIDLSSVIIAAGVCMGFVAYSDYAQDNLDDTHNYQNVVENVKTLINQNINNNQAKKEDTTKSSKKSF